jgi:hypothetical protein
MSCPQGFRQNIGKGVIHMTHASLEERSSLVASLRDLANFLEDNPEVPAPRRADVLVFPPSGTDTEMKAEIDRIAALIGADVNDQTADNGHYAAARKFGPVRYEAVGIPARWRARRAAQMSYADNIIVPADSSKEA